MTYAEEAVLGNKLFNDWSVILQVRYKTCEKYYVKYNPHPTDARLYIT